VKSSSNERWLVVGLSAIALGFAWLVTLLDHESGIPSCLVPGRGGYFVIVILVIVDAGVSAMLLFLRKSAVFLISILASLAALWRILLVLAT
jgi:hypothetical protein